MVTNTSDERSAVVSLRHIAKDYRDANLRKVPVIRDLTFDVHSGEFVSIVGPSGCGKSTMLNIISGLLPPSSGSVTINDRVVDGPTTSIAYMMQQDLLMEWRTIRQNIELGLELRHVPTDRRHEVSSEYLRRFGMSEFADSRPGELSGGMCQRVALMRTLALDPDIILLDEPFSALDYQTRLLLEDEVLRTFSSLGKTGILITHDIGEAIVMSDRVVVVANRPTSVKEIIDVGICRHNASVTESRSDPEYSTFFQHIWGDLDQQHLVD